MDPRERDGDAPLPVEPTEPAAPDSRARAPRSPKGEAMTDYDSTSFTAGRDVGTRVAASMARLAALELVYGSRWWNRRRRRWMASALVACAEELEESLDGSVEGEGRGGSAARLSVLEGARER